MTTIHTLQTYGAVIDDAVISEQLSAERAAELDRMMHEAAQQNNLRPGDALPEEVERALRAKLQELLAANATDQ